MSADMMIICKEDNSGYEGNYQKAFFIDETSMGDPWNKFGKWFQERYCKSPSIIEQMAGIKEHNFIKLTEADLDGIKKALNKTKCHKGLNKEGLIKYIEDHINKHISTENW